MSNKNRFTQSATQTFTDKYPLISEESSFKECILWGMGQNGFQLGAMMKESRSRILLKKVMFGFEGHHIFWGYVNVYEVTP